MTSSKSFVVGAPVTISLKIRVDNQLTDPTATTIIIEAPSGTDSTPVVSDDGVGLKSFSFTPTEAGWHRFQVKGTGTAAFLQERTFYAATPSITPD
jgi:hypothetical protein